VFLTTERASRITAERFALADRSRESRRRPRASSPATVKGHTRAASGVETREQTKSVLSSCNLGFTSVGRRPARERGIWLHLGAPTPPATLLGAPICFRSFFLPSHPPRGCEIIEVSGRAEVRGRSLNSALSAALFTSCNTRARARARLFLADSHLASLVQRR